MMVIFGTDGLASDSDAFMGTSLLTFMIKASDKKRLASGYVD
jgi:hypothetical protein